MSIVPAPFGRRAGRPVPVWAELARAWSRWTEGRPVPAHRGPRRTR